jgi:Asp-tRNA(Asn)/Glu-tRNA(Gln) amidotransferase A subunit family amidase
LSAWDAAFGVCDVVAVPTLPGRPARIDDPKVDLPGGRRSADLAQIALNAPMNVAGLPALSVPCGLVDGLATGMTLVGRKGADEAVLAAGAELENRLDGALRDRVAPSAGTGDLRGAR